MNQNRKLKQFIKAVRLGLGLGLKDFRKARGNHNKL